MTDNQWAERGPEDEVARGDSIPAWIEVEPEKFKRVDDCTGDELHAAADSVLMQAQAAMAEARALYELAERKRAEGA